jgi:hypothetical protein
MYARGIVVFLKKIDVIKVNMSVKKSHLSIGTKYTDERTARSR